AYTMAIIFVGATAVTCLTGFSTPDKGKGKTAVLAFYNVENLFDTINDPSINDDEFTPDSEKGWNTERYSDKIEKIASTLSGISKNHPSIIGLCEIENADVLNHLVASEPMAKGKYEIAHFDSPDMRGIDVALLYAKKDFKPSFKKAIRVTLPETERPTRDILYVKGTIKKGPEIHVFVNHWPSRYGGADESEYKRLAAAKTLRNQIDSIRALEPNAHIVCMGDFNDYPNNKSVSEILGIGTEENSLPMCNLMDGLAETHRGSYNYRGNWGFLDQIIVSCSLQNQELPNILDGATAPYYVPEMIYTNKNGKESPSRTYGGPNYYGGYSDHLPVYTVLAY
ncbi:MAG: hypothetical protein ABR574_06235, partial [Cryomorphaceae bacterium]